MQMKWKQICIFVISLLCLSNLWGQHPQDSATNQQISTISTNEQLLKIHNPKIAVALSATLPGAGQIYNKKWWKVPIIYAGLAVSSYFIYDFSVQTKLYQNEYKYRINGMTDKLNPKLDIYTDENLLALKNYYRRNMEISIAALAIIYFLNIIDAAVDAHLFYFDISDALSLSVQPFICPNINSPSLNKGVSFAIQF